MKNARKVIFVSMYRSLSVLFIGCAFLMGCQKDDESQPTPAKNIVQTIGEKPEFSTLAAALAKTGLDSTLNKNGMVTVFAPTNAAFAGLPAPFTDAASIRAITDAGQVEQLRTILDYHVAYKRINVVDIAPDNDLLPILIIRDQKPRLVSASKTANGLYINGNAKVVTPDIQASNGVVHGIDHVILP